MDYVTWRDEIFRQPPEKYPGSSSLPFELSPLDTLDHIDCALNDPEIHCLFTKEQIGIGLNLIYSSCSNLPHSYLEAGDEDRQVQAIQNMAKLYSNFFERYCLAPVTEIGTLSEDGEIGFLCHMLWDIFVVYHGNSTPRMVNAVMEVMGQGIQSANDNCIASAIHGLGHWSLYTPQAPPILWDWLLHPTSKNEVVIEYARQATWGCIL
jgi:hypothetical protein